MEKIDIVIVGGGIIGLWSAYEILRNKPHLSLVLCEKEQYLGEHSTGRNSEVLHSGIYYENQSLKHLTCIEGNELWRSFIKETNLSFLDCGKYVVSTTENQARFKDLFQNALKNGVPGVRMASAQEIADFESEVRLEQAFFCPTSGVLNVSEAIGVLNRLIEDLGGIILRGEKFQILEKDSQGFLFQAGGEKMKASVVVNAAGHFAVDLRAQANLQGYKNRFVKGNYLILKEKLKLNQLFYPIPPVHGLGLGIHLTLDTSGAQKFGPNTEDVSNLDYSVNEGIIDQMYPSISELFPTVKKKSLALAYSGIRSRIVNSKGELIRDFIFGTPKEHGVEGYYEFLGIESPGITASPALARKLYAELFC